VNRRQVLLHVGRRAGIILLQALGVLTATFILIRLLPGNPAYLMAGPQATEETVSVIERRLGLNEPLPTQYADYIKSVASGDLGDAWSTGNPVTTDLRERVPVTIFLVSVSLAIAGGLALVLAAVITARPRGIAARLFGGYAFVAGSLPDFWIALGLIFLVYYKLGAVPPPAGQVDPLLAPATHTGIAPIDALLDHDLRAARDALAHMILPVATLVIVYTAPILRLTAGQARTDLGRDHIRFAQALGLREGRVIRYALRSALPTFVTILGTMYGFLLGGAVLVETIFGWGGVGQYAVLAVTQADYTALQGFIIVAGIFTALVYAAVDVFYLAVNPRARAR
jgi:ABC-type dipeptide/oligopeptide/nickel transport system permease component